jgi:hypothetical protein
MSSTDCQQSINEIEQRKEDWMNSKWRPMMGWTYMITCITDFVIFPILWSTIQALGQGQVNIQWQPITLQGAGLFHIAMGAILGIAAYGRTQEKMCGVHNGKLQLPLNIGTTYTSQPAQNDVRPNTGRTAFRGPEVIIGPRGKFAPIQPDHPEL